MSGVAVACLAGLCSSAATARTDAEVAIRPDLVQAGLSQKGRSLIASIWTRKTVPLKDLDRRSQHAGGYLCVGLTLAGGAGERRLCLGGPDPYRRVGLVTLDGQGKTTSVRELAARVERSDPKHLVLVVVPGRAGLAPDRYRWRVLERRGGCGQNALECESRLPPGSSDYLFRLRPVRPVGCTGGSAGLVRHGPQDRPAIALSFDDGPSEYTPGFLDVLREKRVPATFFEVGQEMAGREGTMRRILREGDEIGNHTMHHTEFPGRAEIAPDSALVERYTRFRPCLFRPPGGAVDSAVVAAAAGLGMKTITWDVDPRDWTTPGSAAVYSRVVEATRAGSIVLMHDGGGPRGGTLAALPAIIDTLRARGYRFETVSDLLGHRLIYRPYG
ncbi:MAG: polysaccharide deacetylase family protein [Solirubrobacterales bacterium]